MTEELDKVIENLNLPDTIKQDLKRDYLAPTLTETETKKMVKMSNGKGLEAVIVLWEDETITVISTDKEKEPHISSASSPEMYYIAQKHYIDLGLQITYAEENGKKVGK